jgi:hypothetical protein
MEQYLAFGSSDLINWVRACLMIWPTGVEGLFEFRASKRGEKIGWRVAKPGPDDEDQETPILVPAFTRLFKHWKGTTTLGDEVVEVTAWVEPEPGDELGSGGFQSRLEGRCGLATGQTFRRILMLRSDDLGSVRPIPPRPRLLALG